MTEQSAKHLWAVIYRLPIHRKNEMTEQRSFFLLAHGDFRSFLEIGYTDQLQPLGLFYTL